MLSGPAPSWLAGSTSWRPAKGLTQRLYKPGDHRQAPASFATHPSPGARVVMTTATVAEDAPLYPPDFDPPAEPLGLLQFARAMASNPLRVVPQAAYREPLVKYGKRFFWVTDPGLIKRILLDDREKFDK